MSFFLFKQKTAYEMRISDWSSDVCSSDLPGSPPSRGHSESKAGLTALFLAVRFQVKHRIVAALGHQAEPAGDFLIGLDLAAQVAAEAVLVELFVGDHVPQAAAVGADLVGQDDPAVVAIPDAPEFQLAVDQANAAAPEKAAH